MLKGHWLADVNLAGYAPVFTLSQDDCERPRKSSNAHNIEHQRSL